MLHCHLSHSYPCDECRRVVRRLGERRCGWAGELVCSTMLLLVGGRAHGSLVRSLCCGPSHGNFVMCTHTDSRHMTCVTDALRTVWGGGEAPSVGLRSAPVGVAFADLLPHSDSRQHHSWGVRRTSALSISSSQLRATGAAPISYMSYARTLAHGLAPKPRLPRHTCAAPHVCVVQASPAALARLFRTHLAPPGLRLCESVPTLCARRRRRACVSHASFDPPASGRSGWAGLDASISASPWTRPTARTCP